MSDLSSKERFDVWHQFRDRWPIEKLRTMTLDEYTALTKVKGQEEVVDENDQKSFSYWVEFKADALGGNRGGSAYKFGIFKFRDEEKLKPKNNMRHDHNYAWYAKYGSTAEEAYQKIHQIIVSIAESSFQGDWDAIDKKEIDLGDVTKWKIAFLYQNMEHPRQVCVYDKDCLKKFAATGRKKASYSDLYKKIDQMNAEKTDIFLYSDQVWMKGNQNLKKNAWLIASGENGCFWDDFYKNNVVKIGWNELGNLSSYSSKEEVNHKLTEIYPEYAKKDPSKAGGMVWRFYKEIKIGDIVYVKKGASQIVGRGIVKSDYQYIEEGEYYNVREVQWTHDGSWNAENIIGGQYAVSWLKPKQIKMLDELLQGEEQSQISEEFVTEQNAPSIPIPLNIILYGPPGTGKTHKLLKEYAEQYFVDHDEESAESRNQKSVKVLPLWQVLALAMLDYKKPVAVPELMNHPLVQAKFTCSINKTPNCAVWGELQKHTKEECEFVKGDLSRRANPMLFSKDKDSFWSLDEKILVDYMPDAENFLKDFHQPLKKKENLRYRFVTFHQSFSYENFVEGLAAETDEETGQITYSVKPGIFREMCDQARQDRSHNYALFIDEINRGNVSSIFGELITLIEENKRDHGDEKITVKLPYSHDEFSVPDNLYIIGTMNTADRSVEALDSALRRRFSFVEVPPQPELLKDERFRPLTLNFSLKALLESINNRVEFLLDRDHRIGHSYFMKVRGGDELKNLRRVFKDQIIPLLEDYFYGNLEKVAMVLGEDFVGQSSKLTSSCLMTSGDEMDLPDKQIWVLKNIDDLKAEDFAKIIK